MPQFSCNCVTVCLSLVVRLERLGTRMRGKLGSRYEGHQSSYCTTHPSFSIRFDRFLMCSMTIETTPPLVPTVTATPRIKCKQNWKPLKLGHVVHRSKEADECCVNTVKHILVDQHFDTNLSIQRHSSWQQDRPTQQLVSLWIDFHSKVKPRPEPHWIERDDTEEGSFRDLLRVKFVEGLSAKVGRFGDNHSLQFFNCDKSVQDFDLDPDFESLRGCCIKAETTDAISTDVQVCSRLPTLSSWKCRRTHDQLDWSYRRIRPVIRGVLYDRNQVCKFEWISFNRNERTRQARRVHHVVPTHQLRYTET